MNKEMSKLYACTSELMQEGYTPHYVSLYGAQNYHLERKGSDYDFKAVVFPTLEDVCFNRKPVSKSVELSDGAQCDVKDVRLMVEQWKKGAPNFMELLFSDWQYQKGESYLEWFFDHKEEISHANELGAAKAMLGMMEEKLHALCHNYPSQMANLEKYGYAGKQLSHLLRMYDMLCRYKEVGYKELLTPDCLKECLDLKTYDKLFTPVEALGYGQALVAKGRKKFAELEPYLKVDGDFLHLMEYAAADAVRRKLEDEVLEKYKGEK